MADTDLHRLVYASRMTPETQADVERVLDAILEVALERNARERVSGLLVGHRGRFFQALEGARGALDDIYASIAADPRHFEVDLLLYAPARGRLFERWAMCAHHMSETDADILKGVENRPAFDPAGASGHQVLELLEIVAAIHPRTLSARAARLAESAPRH